MKSLIKGLGKDKSFMLIKGFELHEGCIFITNIMSTNHADYLDAKEYIVHNVLTPVLCFATIETIIFTFSFIYMRNNYNKCLVRSLKTIVYLIKTSITVQAC